MFSLLERHISEFTAMKIEFADLLSNISDKKFNNRASDKTWSVAECVDHLIITGYEYSQLFERALNETLEKEYFLNGKLKGSWIGRRFAKSLEPPPGIRLKSPVRWKPATGISKSKVSNAIIQLQDRWIELIEKSDGLDISRVKYSSPVTKLIRFTAYDMIIINLAHQRRHLWQIRNILKNFS
ncbi:MAG: DinB family protein [Ignavibacteria bacterium]|nr:DinB family protein [Ignavibacteria bacterium]